MRTIISSFVILILLSQMTSVGPANEVQYKVTFDATWQGSTHPNDFPSGAHFSPLVGGTHNADVSFWESGGISTPGVESMAETGAAFLLTGEVNDAITAGSAFSAILGGGTGSPGSVDTTFDISSTHPLATVVTMVAPSPDWFLGVSGLNLFENGRWLDDVVVDLLTYDAGTDSGPTFRSANDDTQPREPIARLTEFPLDSSVPLGTFTFDLLTPQPVRQPGDANEDWEFGTEDITLVLGAGKYETGQPATWAEGDWNENGFFESGDIVLALGTGLYETGRYAAHASVAVDSVPEPSALALLALGMVGVLRHRPRGVKRPCALADGP